MADESRPVKHRSGGGFRGFLTSLLILALVGVVGILYAARTLVPARTVARQSIVAQIRHA